MSLRLLQLKDDGGGKVLAAHIDGRWKRIAAPGTRELALSAIERGTSLAAAVETRLTEDVVDVEQAEKDGRLLPPIDHEDPAHLHLTGTGLTHLGSAEGRDKMHKAAADGKTTDSMRMFLMGLEGGKPADGRAGVQPEWFYKGDGSCLVGTGCDLQMPGHALDGGEEPEIAGIYIIDNAGNPRRIGFALANEYSDHVMERGNYLWLAHSKLRQASLGADLLVGQLPDSVQGTSRVVRNGNTLWEQPFLSGETNMSHSIANLEHHHFKYAPFRRPGDVHVHFFGTATLSFSDGIQTQEGDVFEISADPFLIPLRNKLVRDAASPVAVSPL